MMFLTFNPLQANNEKFEVLRNNLTNAGKSKEPAYNFIKNSDNEFQIMFSGLYWFYKEFISSQDEGNCQFWPSCSEFGLLAIQQQGAFIGIINTFDRLMRCNGLSPELYEVHPERRLLKDPVK